MVTHTRVRVAICAQQLKQPLVGGVDVYADRLARAFERIGYQSCLISFDPESGPASGYSVTSDEHDGRPIRRIRFRLASRSKQVFDTAYDPMMAAATSEVLRDLAPDVFIITNFYLPTLASVEAAAALRSPIVHIATDFVPVCRRGTYMRWDGRSCEVGESVRTCAACFVSHRVVGRVGASILGMLPEEVLIERSSRQEPEERSSLLARYYGQVAITHQRLEILESLRPEIALVLAPTRFAQQVFMDNGFGQTQVRYLPFGVEEAIHGARAEERQAGVTRFLFVGRLQPYKGAEVLVDAFNGLKTPRGASLTLYGKADGHPEYFQALQNKIAGNSSITFGGQIPPSELPHALQEADYFVLPSLWHENSPLVLLDALQSHTPVIASDVGGVTDLIDDEENGLLFPMGDVQALRAALQRAIDEPGLKAKLSHRTDQSLMDIDAYARTVMSLLNGALEAHALAPYTDRPLQSQERLA